MENNLKYWIWFSLCSSVGGELRIQLLEEFSFNPMNLYYAERSDLEKMKLSPPILSSLMNKNLDRVNDILGACDRLGIFLMTYQDAIYPQSLRALADPPMVLYGKGRMPRVEEQVTIAMVGARKPSEYGFEMATRFAYDLTMKKALVVTGMAEGIDTACVQGVLKAGGPIVSVVAGGVDMCFPASSTQFYRDVPHVGVLLSEYPPGTRHQAQHFRFRNRLLSGLSSGVMIVESKETGGTMLTAKIAIGQQKDIFVLPGDIRIPTMSGNIALMQSHTCYAVGHPDHILKFYHEKYPQNLSVNPKGTAERLSDIPKTEGQPQSKKQKGRKEKQEVPVQEPQKQEVVEQRVLPVISASEFSLEERSILSVMGDSVYSQDDIVSLTELSPQKVMMALVTLEENEHIVAVADRHYRAEVIMEQEEQAEPVKQVEAELEEHI